MFKHLIKNFSHNSNTTAEAEDIRQQLQSIFFKIRSFQNKLENNPRLNFKVTDDTIADTKLKNHRQVTYYLGPYAIRYDLGELKSIQLYRRGKVDSLQYAELLAISFNGDIEYITDKLFVKADVYQLEILINHVIKNDEKL